MMKFICTECGPPRDTPCMHWRAQEDEKRWKFVQGALSEMASKHEPEWKQLLEKVIANENILISELDLVLEAVNRILNRPQSATLKIEGTEMPASILVGGTASSLFQEWTGPSGTGTVVPNAGAPAYTSDNPAVATVDPASGVATGVSAGTANITGTDPVNNLTASDVLTVNTPPPPPAVSATLTLTAN